MTPSELKEYADKHSLSLDELSKEFYSSDSQKLPKDDPQVNYQSASPHEDHFCGNCRFYQGYSSEPIGYCSLVKGEIAQAGYSDLYRGIMKAPLVEGDSGSKTDDSPSEDPDKSKSKRSTGQKDEGRGKKKKSYESAVTTPFKVIEATKDKTGTEWLVRIINEGRSANRRDYPLEVLHRDKDIFEGVPVHAAIGEDHSMAERGVKSIVGFIKNIQAVSEGLNGIFHVSDPDLKAVLLDLHNEGKLEGMMGFSIAAQVEWFTGESGLPVANRLIEGVSVDLVRDPAAGGKFLQVTENKDEGKNPLNKEDSMVLELTEERLQELLKEASTAGATSVLEQMKAKESEEESEEKEVVKEEVEEKEEHSEESLSPVLKQMYSMTLSNMIAESKLPEVSRKRVRLAFENKVFDPADVTTMIQEEKDYVASLNKTKVDSLVTEGRMTPGQVTLDEWDTKIARIDAMFDVHGEKQGIRYVGEGNKQKVFAYSSFTEAYSDIAGVHPYSFNRMELWHNFSRAVSQYDSEFTRIAKERRISGAYEALATTDWADVVVDRLHNALLLNYDNLPQYADWKKVARNIPVQDFQPHRDTKVGGYANLATVVERGTYPDLTHPADEQTSATLAKHGGIAAQITMELVVNDQIGAIAQIPKELARAAARTLYEAVFDVLINNATYGPDSTALFHANHSNTGTTALSLAGVRLAEVAMRDQTKYGSTADILGAANAPAIIIVPNELRALAMRIANPSEGFGTRVTAVSDGSEDNDLDIDPYHYRGQLEVITLDYHTDASEYYLMASPDNVAGIGVLFMNNNEEPELFVQNDETQGETFTSDVRNIKIRHMWQTVLRDYRPFYRQT